LSGQRKKETIEQSFRLKDRKRGGDSAKMQSLQFHQGETNLGKPNPPAETHESVKAFSPKAKKASKMQHRIRDSATSHKKKEMGRSQLHQVDWGSFPNKNSNISKDGHVKIKGKELADEDVVKGTSKRTKPYSGRSKRILPPQCSKKIGAKESGIASERWTI